MATKKDTNNAFNWNKNYETVKSTSKDVSDFIYKTSEEMVDLAITRSAQWQDLGAKAIKGGLKVAEKQQDIMFDALEMVKGQVDLGTKRFKKLFSLN